MSPLMQPTTATPRATAPAAVYPCAIGGHSSFSVEQRLTNLDWERPGL